MKKARQILAIIGIILLIGMYALTMIFALMKNPIADRLLMAAIFCTVAVPVILYGMMLVAKNLERRGREIRRGEDEAGAPLSDASEDAAKADGTTPE